MGGSKRMMEADMEEQQRKAEELLDLPSMLASAHEDIGELKAEIRIANTFKAKIPDYLIGGLVGAVLGCVLTYFVG
jgi:hypothetical protein